MRCSGSELQQMLARRRAKRSLLPLVLDGLGPGPAQGSAWLLLDTETRSARLPESQ